MTPEQARSLVLHAQDRQVEEAARLLARGGSVLEARALLEASYDSPLCLAILDCLSCRERFAHKFENAERWLLTREAAEQASDSRISRWRAETLAEGSPGRLVELGCGLGGDTVSLSEHFEVTAWERCEARAQLARYNLGILGKRPCAVECAEADCRRLEGEVLFVDPARRDGTRLSRPQSWQPPLPTVVDCFREGRFQRLGVKVAPGITDGDLPDLPIGLSFLSVGGNLKEAFLLLDHSIDTYREAVLFTAGGRRLSFRSSGWEIPISEPSPGLYLHNPDPAILRANALDQLARHTEAGIVHPKIGYLVGPKPVEDGSADSFQILEAFPLKWKILKKKLAVLG
ncbi:MAG: hypothetical protein KC800_32560, partial [Candidatus Eremiobacteraeota bacterium]|nr:hypothetical protein [Candidatus Eremiobacteraeota bacterium]